MHDYHLIVSKKEWFSAAWITGSYGMMYSHCPWNRFLNWYPIPCLMKSLFWPSSKFDVQMCLGQLLIRCRSWQEWHNSREIVGESQSLDFLIQCGESSLIQLEQAVYRMQLRCFIGWNGLVAHSPYTLFFIGNKQRMLMC